MASIEICSSLRWSCVGVVGVVVVGVVVVGVVVGVVVVVGGVGVVGVVVVVLWLSLSHTRNAKKNS